MAERPSSTVVAAWGEADDIAAEHRGSVFTGLADREPRLAAAGAAEHDEQPARARALLRGRSGRRCLRQGPSLTANRRPVGEDFTGSAAIETIELVRKVKTDARPRGLETNGLPRDKAGRSRPTDRPRQVGLNEQRPAPYHTRSVSKGAEL